MTRSGVVDAGTVQLVGADCAYLAARLSLDDVRIAARSADRRLYEILSALHDGSLRYRAELNLSLPPGGKFLAADGEAARRWTPTEVAAAANRTPRRVRQAIRADELPAERVERRWVIDDADAVTWIASRRKD